MISESLAQLRLLLLRQAGEAHIADLLQPQPVAAVTVSPAGCCRQGLHSAWCFVRFKVHHYQTSVRDEWCMRAQWMELALVPVSARTPD